MDDQRYGEELLHADLLMMFKDRLKDHFEKALEKDSELRFYSRTLDHEEFFMLLVDPLADERGNLRELLKDGRAIKRICHQICERGLGPADFSEGARYYAIGDWFQRVIVCYESFDFAKFEPIVIQPERGREPGSDFRILDGNHRALGYALAVLSGKVEFRPVQVIFQLKGPPEA